MAPPPVTPSPHRFVVKKQPPFRPVQQHTPLSSTQQFNATPRFNTTPRFTNPTPSQSVARNALPISTPLVGRAATTAHGPSRLQESIEDEDITDVEEDIEYVESIEDESPRDGAVNGFPGNVELEDDIQQSIEEEDMLLDSPAEQEDDIYVADFKDSPAKRRRLDSSPLPDLHQKRPNRAGQDEVVEELDEMEDFSSSITEISSPSAPVSRPQTFSNIQSRPTPRFLPPSTPQHSRFQTTGGVPSTPLSSSAYIHRPLNKPGSGTHTFAKPRRFRPASPPSQAAGGEPLPDAFSPRRRGEKYVIGGLASELRSWIFNIGNEPRSSAFSNSTTTTSSSYSITNTTMGHVRNRISNKEREQWKTQIIVDEMSGGYGASQAGMTLIRGRPIYLNSNQANSEELNSSTSQSTRLRIMLAGTGTVDGLNRTKRVEVGLRIGIQGPTWEIDVGGEKWRVVVKWRVM